MNDSDDSLDLLVRIKSDVAGAEAATKALNTAKGASTENTDALKQGSKAAQEHGGKIDELAEKTGFLNLKKAELKKLVRELGREFPIVGMAGRMMMDPIVASLTLGIMAFGAAKAKLAEWDAALEVSAKRNASRDFLPGIEAKKEALDQAAASAADFEVALGNIGRAEDKFKTKISDAIDKLHEFSNAQAEVNSAAEAKELAEVDLKQKTGKLDEIGGIKQRASIKERYRKMQDALKTKTEQDELNMQETELVHDKQSQPGLIQAEDIARKKRDALKARMAQARKDLEEGEKKSAEYAGDVAKALAKLETVDKDVAERGVQFGMSSEGHLGDARQQANEDVERAQSLKNAQDRFNARNKRLIKTTAEFALPKAEGEFGVAETRARANAERVNELQQTIPAKREIVGIREQGREVAGGLKDKTTGIEATAQIAQEVHRGQEKMEQLTRQMLTAAKSGGPVTEETIKAFLAQEILNKKMTNELTDYSRRILRLEGTVPRP